MKISIPDTEILARYQSLLKDWTSAGVSDRFWRKDPTLWKKDRSSAEAIRQRLGWLDLPKTMAPALKEISSLVEEVRRDHYTHVVLLGMGGSSLAPEVFHLTFGRKKGFLALHVLDTTDPETIQAVEKKCPPAKTLFVVSSKSGSTIEVASLFRYFWRWMEKKTGSLAGRHFVAITDPGTALEVLAKEKNFRAIFSTPPDVGGRFSVLTAFGLLPAALLGVDVSALLRRAARFAKQSGPLKPAHQNPALQLGAALGLLGQAGRDKITFLLDPRLAAFGLWVEQLIAESTGKENKGLLPVEGEPLGRPAQYGKDRVFVSIPLGAPSLALKNKLKDLRQAGHPLVEISLKDRGDLGGEFFRWEMVTAAVGIVWGINPFDQPNVAESKANTERLLSEMKSREQLPEGPVACRSPRVSAWADFSMSPSAGVDDLLCRHLDRARPGDYVALMAYLPATPTVCRALERFRRALWALTGCPVTLGFGPRFLHSTGQLHKGGPNNGLFIQLTQEDSLNQPIPDVAYGFSTLKKAQAVGDYRCLLDHGRRAVRLHLKRPVEKTLLAWADVMESDAQKIRTTVEQSPQ